MRIDNTKEDSDTARRGARGRFSLSSIMWFFAAAFVAVQLIIAGVIGFYLVGIKDQATRTTAVTIPRTIAQNEQAVNAELLARFAEIALHTVDERRRSETRRRAETVAAELAGTAGPGLRPSVEAAGQSISLTADAMSRAHQMAAEIEAHMQEADRLIREIDDNVYSIVDDTSYRLEDALGSLLEIVNSPTNSDHHSSDFSDDVTLLGNELQDSLNINSASQAFLANLRSGKNLLLGALSLEDQAAIAGEAEQFARTVAVIEAQMGRFPTTGDYEYLPRSVERFATLSVIFDLRAQILRERRMAAAEHDKAQKLLAEIRKSLSEGAAETAMSSTRAIARNAATIQWIGLAMLVVVVVAMLVIGTVIVNIVVRPVARAAKTLDSLGRGDLDVRLPPAPWTEFLAIRNSIGNFRDALVERETMLQEKDAARRAKEQRVERITRLTDGFDAKAREVLQTVSSAATELRQTAENMSAIAEETSHQATAVSSASNEASANVQTVATAAEQMSASIAEIGRQVGQSAKIAGKAVDDARQTNQAVRALDAAAQKIGEVVTLINDIAGQTNLLALNATIEAARAGEAGKGFAVVASEVKGLANQTAKATDEITQQITSVQDETRGTVAAIDDIMAVISEVSDIATTIASAVEQQGVSTREIARNVQQAARGTQEVTDNIAGVTTAAANTGAASNQVLNSAQQLSQQAEILRGEVERFLAEVRTA
jgi:methyl-accepting chemotaxis protein